MEALPSSGRNKALTETADSSTSDNNGISLQIKPEEEKKSLGEKSCSLTADQDGAIVKIVVVKIRKF